MGTTGPGGLGGPPWLPRCAAAPAGGQLRLERLRAAESSRPQRVLCVGWRAEAGVPAAEPWPGLLGSWLPPGWRVGILSYPLPLPPPSGPVPAGNPQEPATLALPFLVGVLPRGSRARGPSCSRRWAAPVWRCELAPCWPVERDISSNATEGLPDLHSPARTPFLPPSGLFITVLTGKRASQPSPGPAL